MEKEEETEESERFIGNYICLILLSRQSRELRGGLLPHLVGQLLLQQLLILVFQRARNRRASKEADTEQDRRTLWNGNDGLGLGVGSFKGSIAERESSKEKEG